jgi:hypothetical protein
MTERDALIIKIDHSPDRAALLNRRLRAARRALAAQESPRMFR